MEIDETFPLEMERPAKPCTVHFAMHAAAKPACNCQGLKKPRRIHAACGFLLIGFLFAHLGLCTTGLQPDSYRSAVAHVEAMVAASHGLLLLPIFVALVAQFASGFYLLGHHGLAYNVKKCNRGGKLRFYLQRLSALLLACFLVFHVATLHHWGLHALYRLTRAPALNRYAQGGLFQPQADAYRTTVVGLMQAWSAGSIHSPGNLFLAFFTLLGVIAAAYHAANGVWSGGLVLKIATKEKRRLPLGVAAIATGVLIGVPGLLAWWTFASVAR